MTYNFFQAIGEYPPKQLNADENVREAYRLHTHLGFLPQTLIRIELRHNPDLDDEAVRNDPGLILPLERCLLVVHRAKLEGPRSTYVEVSAVHWETLNLLLSASRYWELPEDEGRVGGFDSTIFTLDGFQDGKTHRVARWSPNLNDGESFILPCEYLLDLAALAEVGHFNQWPIR
jgi:hypothetical protein